MNFQLFVGSSDDLPLGFGVHFHFAADSGAFYYRDARRQDITGNHRAGLKLHPLPGMNGSAYLTGYYRFLRVQVPLLSPGRR
jgi:hypothetical protein